MSAGADRVQALVELGRWSAARTMLAPLLAAEPDDADLHELDAAIHDGLGDPTGVLAAAGRAAALDPEREAPHRRRAHAHHDLGDRQAAYQEAREAQRLAPHSWAAHTTAAMMASEAGATDEAQAAADRALALAPGVASTHFAAGFVAQGQGRRREARRHYRRTLALEPEHAQALVNLTSVSSRGRPGRAMRGYAEALRVDPHDRVALSNLLAVTIGVLKRVFLVGLLAAVAGTLLTGLGTSPVNAGSRAAGALAAAVVVGLVGSYLGGTTRPVRTALRTALGRRWEFWITIVAVTAMVAIGVAACWVPGLTHAVGRHGLVLWLLLVLPVRTTVRSWWRRRGQDCRRTQLSCGSGGDTALRTTWSGRAVPAVPTTRGGGSGVSGPGRPKW